LCDAQDGESGEELDGAGELEDAIHTQIYVRQLFQLEKRVGDGGQLIRHHTVFVCTIQ